MKLITDYFTDEAIIKHLCKLRAKQARKRNKKHTIHTLTGDSRYNYHAHEKARGSEYEQQFIAELSLLMPRRRQWKALGSKSRYKSSNQQRLNSVDRNTVSLIRTIYFFKRKKPNEPCIKNLERFIEDIKTSILDPKFSFKSPAIYPKPKNLKKESELKPGKKNECRPIALFSLKERIILSITNKYLTALFDDFFELCSLAFRSNKKVNGIKTSITHHTAIKNIVGYKTGYKHTPLWIAECDIKKFYDTVNHDIVIKKFNSLIRKVKLAYPHLDLTIAENIFIKYLECYSFNSNVLCYNGDDTYWKKCKIAAGEFEWVEKDFYEKKLYLKNTKFKGCFSYAAELVNIARSWILRRPLLLNSRVGVPQGGALSGLIANIVLDSTDKVIINSFDGFYNRFCDDMIIMHPDKAVCQSAIDAYSVTLTENKLIAHPFYLPNQLKEIRSPRSNKLPELTLKPFWQKKSKGPYKWADVNEDGFPWIGFVGYEINHSLAIRVRKSSLEKESEKQQKVIKALNRAIKYQQRASNNEIKKSAILRLTGMSIGRVELWNHRQVENEMCWKVGFCELNHNKHSIKQIKRLDYYRSRLYYKFVKQLRIEEVTPKKVVKNSVYQIHYNKPFSYYYQILERHK